MRLPSQLRKRFGSPPAADGEPSAGPAETNGSLPIADYEQLSAKEITNRLHLLTQVELGTIEDHERSHRSRAAVLTKLGWMREDEPLPGYDQLDTEKVVVILADADAETIRTIRDYERKFQHRREISEAVTRLSAQGQAQRSRGPHRGGARGAHHRRTQVEDGGRREADGREVGGRCPDGGVMSDGFPFSVSAPPTESATEPEPAAPEAPGEDSIRKLVTRLARPHSSGGHVVERAAILAEGSSFNTILDWIVDHGGVPEAQAAAQSQGLHGARLNQGGGSVSPTTLRFVLPAGVLS